MNLIKFYNNGADGTVIRQLSKQFDIDEKVMEIIYSKGYQTSEQIATFLSPTKQKYVDPFLLSGMKECVEKIREAVKQNKKILIFGDYDVDGMSATAIMLGILKKLGTNASYYLPNRFIDGYGLTNSVIDKICQKSKPDLIITVDCGITCHDEVEYCKSLGIDIIITDHHEIPDVIPDCIVVNPKLKDQAYTFNGLCGTGVAFKIAQAILGFQESEIFISIATIATIADIVPLTDENRVIVAKGLNVFDKYLPYGLKVMCKQNKLDPNKLEASDIAFKIAPKLNASGRMGDAAVSLELMLESNAAKVKALIEKINNYNQKRQEICNKVFDDCAEMLKNQNMSQTPVIILKSKEWDSGILGIVCSRILEIYNRPVILFAQEGDELKGSARSIDDVNIHQVLSSVKDILEVFGGHKVAAGLTMNVNHFDEFCNRVSSFIIQNINTKAFIPINYYDLEINVNDITDKFFNDLRKIEPCGCENSKPRFMVRAGNAKIVPLKPNSLHSYIHIDKKLHLLFFNYLKDAARLNFGKEYQFVFELQSSFKGVYKGIVKTFASSNELKDSATKYFNPLKFQQLKYVNNNIESELANVKTYTPNEVINFVVNCASSVFGTCFVSFNTESYKKFYESYDLSNIFEVNFISTNVTGFNAINICPEDISFAKSYKNIIFLDDILDKSYLQEIQKISDANIFIPELNNQDKNLFTSLNLNRENILELYNVLTKLESELFTSILGLHSRIYKENIKISFENFILYFYILSELNIINHGTKDGLFCYKLNKSIKTDLSQSKIYNTANLIRRIYGQN